MCSTEGCPHNKPGQLSSVLMEMMNSLNIFPDNKATAIALYILFQTSKRVSGVTKEEILAAMPGVLEDIKDNLDLDHPKKQAAGDALLTLLGDKSKLN